MFAALLILYFGLVKLLYRVEPGARRACAARAAVAAAIRGGRRPKFPLPRYWPRFNGSR